MFDGLKVYLDVVVCIDVEIVIVVCKDVLDLLVEVNVFVKMVEKGILFGNIILKCYFKDVGYIWDL